jgi:NAD(P)-dependent dehydrogenase (short-subunit alcohol dehydrogenase family)
MQYLKQLFGLKNKTAIITGGSGILGGEMAKGLLSAEANVIILGTKDDKLKMKLDELKKEGNHVSGHICNVLDEENLVSVKNKILDTYGTIDILINAAGGNMPGATIGVDQNIFNLRIEDFKKVTDLNFLGTVLPSLIFGKLMAEQKRGSIINISSMTVQRAITRVVGYSVAKAAVDNFTKWLAVEMALKFGNDLRVNAIAPGFFLTEQNRTLLTNKDGSLTDRGKTITEMTPFRRFGNPNELIGTVLWLASDASKFITGAVIPVDGGFSAFSGV